MNFKKTTLGVAVATTLGFAASANAAVFINNANSGTSVKIAKERNLETNGKIIEASTGDLNPGFLAIPSYAINANNTLFVKVTLLGGATFASNESKAPSLLCKANQAGSAITGAFQQGGLNSASISFSLASGKTVSAGTASGDACVLSMSGVNLGSQSNVEVSAVVRYKDGLTLKETGYKGTLISFTTAAFATFDKGDAVVVADVRKSSKEFTTTTLPGVKTAYLGKVKYAASGGAVNIDGGAVSAGTIASKLSVTISGPAIAAASKVFLAKTAATTPAAACAVATKLGGDIVPSSNSVTFTGIVGSALKTGAAVCMEVDGTKSMEQGQITAEISAVNQANWVANTTPFGGSNNLVEITKNGTTIRVLNIPKPAGGEKAFIRFYNPTNQAIRISGTLYDQAGTELATGELFASLPANDVEVLSSDTLATKLGVATWTGRAWLKIEADSDNFKVMATLRDGTGTLVNMSNAGRN